MLLWSLLDCLPVPSCRLRHLTHCNSINHCRHTDDGSSQGLSSKASSVRWSTKHLEINTLRLNLSSRFFSPAYAHRRTTLGVSLSSLPSLPFFPLDEDPTRTSLFIYAPYLSFHCFSSIILVTVFTLVLFRASVAQSVSFPALVPFLAADTKHLAA